MCWIAITTQMIIEEYEEEREMSRRREEAFIARHPRIATYVDNNSETRSILERVFLGNNISLSKYILEASFYREDFDDVNINKLYYYGVDVISSIIVTLHPGSLILILKKIITQANEICEENDIKRCELWDKIASSIYANTSIDNDLNSKTCYYLNKIYKYGRFRKWLEYRWETPF